MHAAGKILVKTFLEVIGDNFFPIMLNFPICDIFIQQKGKAEPPPPHSDLPVKKALRVVGLLTVMISFQSKKVTPCKVKDEKEEAIT